MAIVGAILAIVMVGLLDLLTPADVAFAPFYVAPVVLVAWAYGWRAGVSLALIAAGVELLVDSSLLRPVESDEALPILLWNAISSAVAFSSIAVVTDKFYSERERWRAVQSERSRLLGLLEREFPRPLRAIEWFAKTFGEAAETSRVMPDKAREQFAALRHHTREMRFLATDLIQVGRVQSGDLQLQLETIDLVAVAREAAAETLDRNRVTVTASTEVYVLADPESVRHATSAIIGRLIERSSSEVVDVLIRSSDADCVLEFVGRGGLVPTEQELELPKLLVEANGGRITVVRWRGGARILLHLRKSTPNATETRPAERINSSH